MAQALAQKLSDAIDAALPKLRALPDVSDLAAHGWNRKQELGHLIDSATNNHLRFVRATLESGYEGPSYQQNGWVDLHDYNRLPWTTLVDFWAAYNRLLVHLVANIPDSALDAACTIGNPPAVTLGFVIDDYVRHLQHHLDHILDGGITS